jgi:sirohydrochlorin cobaltochelatase
MMLPDVLAAGEELVARRCEAILVVPVFLGQGGHVREDVPALVDGLRKRYPSVAVTQTGAAGEDDGVLDALAAFCLQALGYEWSQSGSYRI